MREIKFRVWDEFTKKMYYQIELVKKEDGYWWMWENGFLRLNCESQRRKIMQYTGLKDKNEKEIYEGDIFASGVIGLICQDRSDCPLYRVVFKEGSFMGQSIPYEEEYSIYIRPEDCEVIGSIHENPELLGG